MPDLNELLQQLEPYIVVRAQKSSIAGMDWEDIAQELRIEVWKKYDKIINGKSKPTTFTFKLFRNKEISLWRRSKPKMDSIECLLTEPGECRFDLDVLESICKYEDERACN